MQKKYSNYNDYVRVCEDGWTGYVHTDFKQIPLALLIDPVAENERCGDFEKVCSSDTAEVYRYSLQRSDTQETLYLKKYPYRSLLDALKHLFRPSRARRAFDAGMMLEKYGLHTPSIIAFLQKKETLFRSEDILITKEMKNATALSSVLGLCRTCGGEMSVKEKRSLITELGQAIGRMHAAKIVHGDLRAGNVFVEDNSDRIRFMLIDNERTTRHPLLPSRLRTKNLVQLNMYRAHISDTDRMRFLKTYRTAAGLSKTQAQRLAQAVSKRTLQRLQHRAKTRTGISDAADGLHWHFKRIRQGHLRGIFQTNFAVADTAAQLLDGIEDLMATGAVLKDDISTRVIRCEYNGLDIVIKRYNYQGFWHSLRHTLKGSRARKCWRFGHLLTAAAIPCAAPLGVIEDRPWGIIRQSYIINAFVEGPMLYTVMTSPDYSEQEKQAARKKAEAVLEQLAKHRMTHSDMKSVNMLVCNGQPILIDLDSMEQHRFGPYFQLRYNKMLQKFKSRLYGRKKR